MINLVAFIFILALMCITVVIERHDVPPWYIILNFFLLLIQVPFIIAYFTDKG